MSEIGTVIAERRKARGLSQQQLAIRAGTTQAAISQIERGMRSPTYRMLGRLLMAIGERPVVSIEALTTDVDEAQLRAVRNLSPAQRLEQSVHWNMMAAQFARAGEESRRG